MTTVTLTNLEKCYPNGHQAISKLNLSIEQGEMVVLVGPSGCGKSTLLRMIAGLETITQGDLFIDNLRVNEHEPSERDIAMVFQNYALSLICRSITIWHMVYVIEKHPKQRLKNSLPMPPKC